MKEGCEILLEKTTYSPGEVITGTLQCTFFSEHKVKGVRVIFFGDANVNWSAGKYVNYEDEKQFLKSDLVVLASETTFQPGTYNYPIVFTLPAHLPSSLEAKYGSIKYKIEAIISRPWAIDYETKKTFEVFSFHKLQESLPNNPVKVTEEEVPTSFFKKQTGPVTIAVELPQNAYAQNEVISFEATINNESSISVKKVRFQLIQGYQFHVGKESTEQITRVSKAFVVIDCTVPSGTQMSKTLELKVPGDMPIALMGDCELITAFWKLRGKVRLPFPHSNFVIDVPLVIGAYSLP
ncbi:hypothetical protein RN001_011204 [Aquatica leii]|uniref:Arrestin C-terminal-like domain-containing protein n=1 Tax=Aquatica leii TaxID=1421715 RepID=A0AAN7SNM9_9COLE|nr:hypothetical protein RN001_011204 [Aquatica leii]